MRRTAKSISIAFAIGTTFFLCSLHVFQEHATLQHLMRLEPMTSVLYPLSPFRGTKVHTVHTTIGHATRNFDYLAEPNTTKYRNRTILFAFSGRRSRQEIQLLYLERLIHDGEIDFVHYYHCGPSQEDSNWLMSLGGKYPSWFELRHCFGDKEPFTARTYLNEPLSDYSLVFKVYEQAEYRDSMLIKIDDDIVYLPVGGAVTRALEYARAHPEASWVSGLVVNNKLVDYELQKDGIIPTTDDLQLPLPIEMYGKKVVVGLPSVDELRKHPKSWKALHDLFLSKNEMFHNLEGSKVFPRGYRVCLNVMFFAPEQLKRWEMRPRAFDEVHIKVMNWQKNLSVHLFMGAPFVHLNYQRQRQANVVIPGYDKKYLHVACSRLNITSSHELCATASITKPP